MEPAKRPDKSGTFNIGQSILDKVSELLNDYCTSMKEIEEVAEFAMLSPSTIQRLIELKPTEEGHDYNPYGDTLSRVLLFFGASITWGQEKKIKKQFWPTHKMYE